MQLPGPRPTKQDLEKFKELYLRRYGKQLSDEEAFTLGSKMVRFVHASLHPLRSEVE